MKGPLVPLVLALTISSASAFALTTTTPTRVSNVGLLTLNYCVFGYSHQVYRLVFILVHFVALILYYVCLCMVLCAVLLCVVLY